MFDILGVNPCAALPQQVTEYTGEGRALYPFKSVMIRMDGTRRTYNSTNVVNCLSDRRLPLGSMTSPSVISWEKIL